MARLLILNECYPDDLTSGRDLRVYRLCSELLRVHECFLVSFDNERRSKDLIPLNFSDTETLPDIRRMEPSFRRHFRLSNEYFMRCSWPQGFNRALDKIDVLQGKWGIEGVINFTAAMSELILHLKQAKLLDKTDSDTLTLERRLNSRGTAISKRERLDLALKLYRQRRREKSLVRRFNVVTTISESDRNKFIELSACDPSRVRIVKNGVDEVALDQGARRNGSSRSVVFWGNLDFPPNWTAINYFYESIFKPFLSDQNIDFYIVGRGGQSHLVNMTEDPRVKLVGFKENLFGFLIDKGVMINPMIEGSGLKNKVLEAFAIGLPVVSTSLGTEAIQATPNKELIVADDPKKFADAVLELLSNEAKALEITNAAQHFVKDQHNWSGIGSDFMSVVSEVFGDTSEIQHPVSKMVMSEP